MLKNVAPYRDKRLARGLPGRKLLAFNRHGELIELDHDIDDCGAANAQPSQLALLGVR